MDLRQYDVFVLDCDGVILDSNHIKSDAMYQSALGYGKNLALELVEYHRQNGGISRYEKFAYFLREMVGQYSESAYSALVKEFATQVKSKLFQAPYIPGVVSLLYQAKQREASLYIVSGGDQGELHELFSARQLKHLFTDIFGSPEQKQIHCENIRKKEESRKTMFFGDSRLDHEAAQSTGFDFVFISDYTDFDEWQSYCAAHEIVDYPDFSTLLQSHPL